MENILAETDRKVFFDWLVASVLANDTHGFCWQVTEDDGTGCITVKFHKAEEKVVI